MPKTMTFRKTDVLLAMEKNLINHREEYKRALEGYRIDFIAECNRILEWANRGTKFVHHIDLTAPVNMSREYERAIAMLMMSTQEEVELDQTEFRNWIMDDWTWKEHVFATNSKYFK